LGSGKNLFLTHYHLEAAHHQRWRVYLVVWHSASEQTVGIGGLFGDDYLIINEAFF